MTATPHHIELCMGSSCFVRGNQHHATRIADWVRRHGVAAHITGHHCRECCASGPVITIDGEPVVVEQAAALDAILHARMA